jgi:hypothetical protein
MDVDNFSYFLAKICNFFLALAKPKMWNKKKEKVQTE